ncbi:MAG TPA: hypothetical protein VF713_12845 [Thermoanaerobaculia bacterium]
MNVLKVQTTLRGYDAWVVENLMTLKGQTLADVTNYLFSRWIDDNAEYLQRFGLSLEKFKYEEDVRQKVRSINRTDAG